MNFKKMHFPCNFSFIVNRTFKIAQSYPGPPLGTPSKYNFNLKLHSGPKTTMKLLPFTTLLTIPVFLLLSCSGTQTVVSTFNDSDTITAPSPNLEKRLSDVERTSINGLSFYVSNDETNLYILVDFVSSRIFQLANEFGFTIYIDNENTFKRSFGLTYPTGLYHELRNYPGAQKAWLENPGWSNIPENKAILETAERSATRNALIVQRRSRRDEMNPVPIPISQLHAQNLFLHIDKEDRSGRISFTLPLQTRSTSQFSPDAAPGESVNVGFEINPTRLFDIGRRGASPMMRGETSGSREQAEEERRKLQYNLMRQLGEPFEEWVKIHLSESE